MSEPLRAADAGRQRGSFEGALEVIRRRIVAGGLAPGDRLPTQRDLARELGMSPTAVREALRELQAQHVVEARHGDGLFVKLYGPQLARAALQPEQDPARAARHIYQARTAIEVAAAEAACREATADDFDQLADIVEAIEGAAWDGVYRRELDLLFHRSMVAASHNPFFLRFSAVIAETFDMRERESRVEHTGDAVVRIASAHREMLTLLRRRDALDLGAMIRLHVREKLWRSGATAARQRDAGAS